MYNKSDVIYIIDAARTPVGKLNGVFAQHRIDDLCVQLLNQLMKRNDLPNTCVEGLMLGCSNQAGEDNRNLARQVSILAQLPFSSSAMTLNSLCSSGLDAILQACRMIRCGEADLLLAGAAENMSRRPMVRLPWQEQEMDSLIGWRFINHKIHQYTATRSMTEIAEAMAKARNISRKELDEYAQWSRKKYSTALKNGHLNNEIIPITCDGKTISKDEQFRKLSDPLLAKLPPMLEDGQLITAGNAARLGDAAALVLLASESFVQHHKIQPVACISGWANGNTPPDDMSVSAAAAIRNMMLKQDYELDQIDRFELSESFAVQTLLIMKALGLEAHKVNAHGGALSIGNPVAFSSARLVCSLYHQFKQQPELRCGIAASSAGLGTGAALLMQRC